LKQSITRITHDEKGAKIQKANPIEAPDAAASFYLLADIVDDHGRGRITYSAFREVDT
tara:strand:+ start:1257 stop:1430 length:174 start_codon:yes stop_codon:yes gene_type:complete